MVAAIIPVLRWGEHGQVRFPVARCPACRYTYLTLNAGGSLLRRRRHFERAPPLRPRCLDEALSLRRVLRLDLETRSLDVRQVLLGPLRGMRQTLSRRVASSSGTPPEVEIFSSG